MSAMSPPGPPGFDTKWGKLLANLFFGGALVACAVLLVLSLVQGLLNK